MAESSSIEEVAQAKRSDGGVFMRSTVSFNKINLDLIVKLNMKISVLLCIHVENIEEGDRLRWRSCSYI